MRVWKLGMWVLAAAVTALSGLAAQVGTAQGNEIITATAIPSEGMAGATSRVRIQITSRTTEEERKSLLAAFQKSEADGMALLRTMSKGYINIEGQPGRKIEAVFTRQDNNGAELVVIGEHVLSKLETARGVKATDFPIAGVHIQFDAGGNPLGGEVFPAVKLKVTPDGFVDFETDKTNKVVLTEIRRR